MPLQRVEVKVSQVGEEERPQTVQMIIETQRGTSWTRDKVVDVTSGGDDAAQTFHLRSNQRVSIVSLAATEDLVYDAAQGAAIRPSSQVNASNRADIPNDTSEVDQERMKQGAARARLDQVMNDPAAIEKAGLHESTEPVNRADLASNEEVKKLEEADKKRIEAEQKKVEDQEKARDQLQNPARTGTGAGTPATATPLRNETTAPQTTTQQRNAALSPEVGGTKPTPMKGENPSLASAGVPKEESQPKGPTNDGSKAGETK